MDEQGLLSYVKKVIHSLIVSTPERMNVERLKRDYASVEGSTVPFGKLGFKDIESFLLSIPDTVVLNGFGPMAQVLAKTSARTAHIQSLVQCQRKTSSKSRGRKKSRPRNWYPSERSDLVFVNEQPRRTLDKNNNHRSNNSNSSSYNCKTKTNSMLNSLTKLTIANVDEDLSSSEQNSLEIYVSKAEIETASNENSKLPVLLNKNHAEAESDNSYIEYLSSNEGCDEDAVPAYAVDERVLNYKHKSMFEESQVNYLSSDEGSEADAVPEYAVDERVISVEYPKDAVRIDQQLPKRDIHKKFMLDDRIEVQLVTVTSPHCFNFWIHDGEYQDYKTMSNSMQRFYNNINEIKYTIPLFLIMVGHLGAVHVEGSVWQRVQVLSIKTGNKKNVEVSFVDTGERTWICHSDLKYLFKEFATLPPQCWTGRLACVMPRQGPCFSLEASNYFFDLVYYRRLYAKIEKINDVDNTVYMVLVNPDAASLTKNINVALIESGWVRRCYKP